MKKNQQKTRVAKKRFIITGSGKTNIINLEDVIYEQSSKLVQPNEIKI